MYTERDWILRAAKALAVAIARAFKLGAQARPVEARRVLESACEEVLGVELRILSMLDATAAVDLLATTERGLAYATLLEAAASLEDDSARRALGLRHALAVVAEVRRRAPRHRDALALEARLHGSLEDAPASVA